MKMPKVLIRDLINEKKRLKNTSLLRSSHQWDGKVLYQTRVRNKP
jgi:hypothetical protein